MKLLSSLPLLLSLIGPVLTSTPISLHLVQTGYITNAC
jgi:hypothetical protein